MFHVLAIILLAVAAGPEVRVTTIDEAAHAGTLREWTAEQVVLQGVNGDELAKLDLKQVLRADFPNAVPDQQPAAQVTVRFVDGSFVSGSQFTSRGDRATIAGAHDQDDASPALDVPLAAVRSVKLGTPGAQEAALAATLDSEWQDILALRPAGDLIVIWRASAGRLNYVEGTLGDVGLESVEFVLDGETIQVNRDRVFGLVFYRKPLSDDASPPAVIVEGSAVRVAADRVTLEDSDFVIDSALLGEIRLPATRVAVIDYSAGQLVYLSDLEPVRAEWTPAPGAAALVPLFGKVARDRSFYSAQLELEYPAASLDPEQTTSAGIPQRVSCRKGLAIRSRTEVTYRIPPGYPRWRATAGIAPRFRAVGQVELRVLGDGQELLQQTIDGRNPPIELQCDVEGVRELTIVVGFGSNDRIDLGSGDILHLCNARITK